jgi:hypothetical protein
MAEMYFMMYVITKKRLTINQSCPEEGTETTIHEIEMIDPFQIIQIMDRIYSKIGKRRHNQVRQTFQKRD